MSVRQKITEIFLGFAAVMILLVIIFGITSVDREGPVISFPEEKVLTYGEDMDKKILLSDVTAEDDKDGNVTDSLVVESVYDFHNGNAKVIYVARDAAGNMSKAERMIEMSVQTTQAAVSATTSEEEKENESTDEAEEDTRETDEEKELVPDGEKPRLRLTEKEVKIKAGESFNALNYVDEIVDDKDDRSALFRRISIKGTYDTRTPGTYELQYFATDTDGNMTNVEKMKLVVEPAE